MVKNHLSFYPLSLYSSRFCFSSATREKPGWRMRASKEMEASIFSTFHPLPLAYLVRLSRTLQSWTKLMTNLDPSPLMGKWCVLAFLRLHPWLWGDNCLLFLYIPPKIAPTPKKNQGWENCAFWPSRGFILDYSGEWVFAVSFFLTHRTLITSL